MGLSTPFTELLECEITIHQAGGWPTPALTAAISKAGALGMISLTGWPPEAMAKRLDAVHALTNRPLGVNMIPQLVEPEVMGDAAGPRWTVYPGRGSPATNDLWFRLLCSFRM